MLLVQLHVSRKEQLNHRPDDRLLQALERQPQAVLALELTVQLRQRLKARDEYGEAIFELMLFPLHKRAVALLLQPLHRIAELLNIC